MIEGAKRMKCGGCGGEVFSVFTNEESSRGARMNVLLIQCDSCKSVTTVSPSAPKLELGWGEMANGILYVASVASGGS